MRRLFPLGLLLAVGAQQACQRDDTTAPRGPQLSALAEHATLQKIAFVSTRDGRARMYVMAADGSGQTRLSSGDGVFTEATPAWSPDGGRIVYASDAVDCECLHAVAPDGSQATQLTDHNSDIGDVEPNWSPDGATLAFTRIFFDNYEIMRIGADGLGETRLTHTDHDVNSTHPRWSPDGQRIAFTRFLPCLEGCTDGNKTEIFIINPDGSGETRLTFTGLNQDMDWSPDGGRLAFTSTRDGNAQIYVMNADGSAQTRLTNNSATDESPRWSPDGQHIAFTSTRDGNVEVYVMNADGSGQTRLTTSPGSDAKPSWSPDGSQIAFTSHRDGHAQIYVMNADGSGQTALTSSAGDNSDPVWAPVRYQPSSAPAHAAFRVAPAAVITAGAVIAPAVRVSVADASWSAVPGGVARLDLEGGSVGATLSGTTQVKLVDGVATFDDLRIDQPGRGYRLRATAGSVSALSTEFAVAGPPAQLAFVAQPPAAVEGTAAMAPAVRVAVQDALGTTVPVATVVTVALGANPNGGTLAGTTTVAAQDGMATFNGLSVDRPGSGYTLTATATGLTGATSAPFAVRVSFASVAAGVEHACGVTIQSVVYCWGDNRFGQLGDGSNTSSTSPVLVAGGLRFLSVSAGWLSSCGVAFGGTAYCWGNNAWGQLGDGTNIARSRPVPVTGGLSFRAVSVGNVNSCGVATSGTAYCWGGVQASVVGPHPAPGGLTFAAISVGHNFVCGVTSAGDAYCWGDNSLGQLGDGTTTPGGPVAVAGGLRFSAVSAGHTHACGVTTSGAAYCWGYNRFGSLGDGTTTNRSSPVAVAGGLTFRMVSTGVLSYFDDSPDHTCGVTTSGAAYCWGWAGLGNGSSALQTSPVAVIGGHTFFTVSAAGGQSCGVTANADAYCWGDGAPARVE